MQRSAVRFGLVALLAATMLVANLTSTPRAYADSTAIVASSDCLQHEVSANDDGSAEVPMPFGINLYGQSYSSLFVNNNGNVTFEAALPTYTPFGIAGAEVPIIAPFFADVDTRSTGSELVRYGWGTTSWEGHLAICVNWINVGYYDLHDEKLNSFQLLIVNREDSAPGDFDIVFNYGSIQWETGDASGGEGGLGGSSATAGFSNGSGQSEGYHEIPGSLVNGAFLDSNANGLANTSTDSSTPGRHIFKVRGGGSPVSTYVALGDSYSSGEGAGDYLPSTDTETNKCHRSLVAWPMNISGAIAPGSIDFGACSGAVIDDLYVSNATERAPFDDGIAQLDRLDESTKLATISIGGNDLGFPDVIHDCVVNYFIGGSCRKEHADAVQSDFDALVADAKLDQTYKEIRSRAPYARVAVVGYPRWFVTEFGSLCERIYSTDQLWINQMVRDLNREIEAAAQRLGIQYIDVYNVGDGRELCEDGPFMNGLVLNPTAHSFHPNVLGHHLIGQTVLTALREPEPGETFNVLPEQTVTHPFFVSSLGGLSVSTQWPGSDVELTLTSPSGRVIDRATTAADVTHEVGPTFESFHVESAEPGQWTATLFGAQVAEGGEETRLVVWADPAVVNEVPVATFTQSLVGATVTVDAASSSDVDGSIVNYSWDFGDGSTATGPTANHTYSGPGDHYVTLAVKDDDGDIGFATNELIQIVDYNVTVISGVPSNSTGNAIGIVQSGKAVPMKFSLGGNFGLDIFATGSPKTAKLWQCPGSLFQMVSPLTNASTSSLSFDQSSSTYTYQWSTVGKTRPSCYQVTLTLKDGDVIRAFYYVV